MHAEYLCEESWKLKDLRAALAPAMPANMVLMSCEREHDVFNWDAIDRRDHEHRDVVFPCPRSDASKMASDAANADCYTDD
eukprot:8774218-Pyramimonas_sp.AAC.1